jgi:PTS system nitrogen regulatory IIA component
MKIQSLIDPARVFLDLEASDVESAMEKLAERLVEGSDLSLPVVANGLLEREKLGSTSVGGGFAIPHCKLTGLQDLIVGLGRFGTSVAFGDPSGAAVRFVFVVLSPPDQPALHLQVLSQIARILKDTEVRSDLLQAASAEDVVRIVQQAAGKEGL